MSSKSKEVLINFIKQYILLEIEKEGFSLVKNKIKLIKRNEDLQFIIDFIGNRYNDSQKSDWEIRYSILCPQYSKWLKKNTNSKGLGFITGDKSDFWENYKVYHKKGLGYDLMASPSELGEIAKEILSNIKNVAIPFFTHNFSIDRIIQNPTENKLEIIDLLILKNRTSEALSLSIEMIDAFEKEINVTPNPNLKVVLDFFYDRKSLIEMLRNN
jgi:hypothetical protein